LQLDRGKNLSEYSVVADAFHSSLAFTIFPARSLPYWLSNSFIASMVGENTLSLVTAWWQDEKKKKKKRNKEREKKRFHIIAQWTSRNLHQYSPSPPLNRYSPNHSESFFRILSSRGGAASAEREALWSNGMLLTLFTAFAPSAMVE
jgi:hypothetical protein